MSEHAEAKWVRYYSRLKSDPERYANRLAANRENRRRRMLDPECAKRTKEKAQQSNLRYRSMNPVAIKADHFKRTYGLSIETHQRMVEEQSGRCAICHIKAKLCVDHNHATDEVRELLCGECNHLIGNARESLDILSSAAAYLTKHNRR